MNAICSVDVRQVRRHFDTHADEYDRYAVVQKNVVERLMQLIESCPADGTRVLEVGSGTGWLSRRLPGHFPGRIVVISDLAHAMTCCAARRTSGVYAADADAQSLPFGPESFGMILSSSVYQWINDLPGAFSENLRVTTPGGWFGFALFGEHTLFELRESHRGALERTGKGCASHAQEFYTEFEVDSALAAAGFETVLLQSENEVEWHPDVPSLLRCLKRIGAQNANSARSGGLSSRKVMAEMARLYTQAYGGEQGIPATYQVIYGLARKP